MEGNPGYGRELMIGRVQIENQLIRQKEFVGTA
jgi:hypothetical protein